jgi:gas vesicle protein
MLLGALGGALVGGAAGWLLLTPEGRRLRATLEPCIVEIAEHAAALRNAVLDIEEAARRGLEALDAPAGREP